jgi:hypothetical protein
MNSYLNKLTLLSLIYSIRRMSREKQHPRCGRFTLSTSLDTPIHIHAEAAFLHFPPINASGCTKTSIRRPCRLGTSVQVKFYSTYVEIWYQARCVARHERCYEWHRKVLELDHYLDTLTNKPGAVAGSTMRRPLPSRSASTHLPSRCWMVSTLSSVSSFRRRAQPTSSARMAVI